ncbi:DUF4253 domain-containing protein [Streptomyces sp. NPDC057877]|uniref:DUF4253 domain-containing protein n=1 Tax=Streptomyces sp. NPDC057877 TaxID=3346269 RepID=UPI0036C40A1E
MATLPNPLPRLTTDPSGRSLGLRLPPGRLIDATRDGRGPEPLLWQAQMPAGPGAWAADRPARRAAGLVPLLVDVGGDQGGPEGWDLAPEEMSYPGDHDAEEVLADLWEQNAADEQASEGADYPGREDVVELFGEPRGYDDTVAPFGPTWPGLAPAGSLTVDPDVHAATVAGSLTQNLDWFKDPRLALVPARRSADILAAVGWTGPLNHEPDTGLLCAVLRSWEDRFGIRVVGVSFDVLVVSVAAPPTTRDEAEAVAAEHYAFCPDNITQGHHETLREYAAEQVLGERTWTFWWD